MNWQHAHGELFGGGVWEGRASSAASTKSSVTITELLDTHWSQLTPAMVSKTPTVLDNVVDQQAALLAVGIVHCDVRYENSMMNQGKTGAQTA